MSKIYLVGMTSNQLDNVKELTDPIWQIVDGLIFVDHESTDGTRELLEERKGSGRILDEKWVNSHDYSMNHILLKGGLQSGDWCLFRDSLERFNVEFAKNIRSLTNLWEMNGVRTVFNYGKIFAFKYNDSMFFKGSPHFGLEGQEGKAIDLKHNYSQDLKEHTWRLKDGEEGGRPIDNKINHEARYAWVYGRSNHLLLGLEDKLQEFQRSEIIRKHIREVAQMNDFNLDIEGLKEFMVWLEERDVKAFHSWINSHRVWKNFYRFHILKHEFQEIERLENEWSYEKTLTTSGDFKK